MKYLILIFFILIPYSSYSQYDDFGVWSTVSLKHKLNRELNLGYKLSHRSNENSKYSKSILNEISISYDIFDFAEIGFEYRHSFNRQLDASYKPESRFAPNLVLKYKINKDLYIDFRTQYQYSLERNNDSNPSYLVIDPLLIYSGNYQYENTLRFRPRIKYEINKKSKISFAYENFIELSDEFTYTNRERFELEYSREITKNSELDISFLYQYQLNTSNPRSDNIICISYSYDLEF